MSYPRIEEKNDQHYWNFLFSLLFPVLLTLSAWHIYTVTGGFPTAISLFDAILISLAVFRVVRLITYDKITQFLRDMFLRSRVIKDEDGKKRVERTEYAGGPLRTIHDLMECPWCTGVWVSLAIVFSYFVFPFAWYVIFFLAAAGVGSLLQLLGNLIGWKAELLKLEATELGSTQKDR